MDALYMRFPNNKTIFTDFIKELSNIIPENELTLIENVNIEYVNFIDHYYSEKNNSKKNVLYELSKFCSVRCFGIEDGYDIGSIFIFSSYISNVSRIVSNFVDNYEIIESLSKNNTFIYKDFIICSNCNSKIPIDSFRCQKCGSIC